MVLQSLSHRHSPLGKNAHTRACARENKLRSRIHRGPAAAHITNKYKSRAARSQRDIVAYVRCIGYTISAGPISLSRARIALVKSIISSLVFHGQAAVAALPLSPGLSLVCVHGIQSSFLSLMCTYSRECLLYIWGGRCGPRCEGTCKRDRE